MLISRNEVEYLSSNSNLCWWYLKPTVSNKNTHLAVFETWSFSRISPEPLELQKSCLHLLHPCLKSFQKKKIGSRNQLIFAKTLFCWPDLKNCGSGAICKKHKFQKTARCVFLLLTVPSYKWILFCKNHLCFYNLNQTNFVRSKVKVETFTFHTKNPNAFRPPRVMQNIIIFSLH